MKNGIIIGSYFIFTISFIFFVTVYLSFLSFQKNSIFLSQSSKVSYTALPTTQELLEEQIVSKDARSEVLSAFLEKYKSDLLPFSQDIIDAADKYELDFRLLPAIAMQESNLCKKIIKDSYNCWGFGIYGKNVKKFKDYPNAIDTVSKTLASDYIQAGLETPEQIMRKYTPSNNGSWARSVNHFMNELSLN